MESASSIAEQDSLSERSTLKGILELAERDGCLRWSDLWLDGSIFEAVKGLQLPQPVEGVHRVALAQHAGALRQFSANSSYDYARVHLLF